MFDLSSKSRLNGFRSCRPGPFESIKTLSNEVQSLDSIFGFRDCRPDPFESIKTLSNEFVFHNILKVILNHINLKGFVNKKYIFSNIYKNISKSKILSCYI